MPLALVSRMTKSCVTFWPGSSAAKSDFGSLKLQTMSPWALNDAVNLPFGFATLSVAPL